MLSIKNLREEKRLSQSDFAQKMGVSLRTIQNWESNQDKIPIDKLNKIYRELGSTLPLEERLNEIRSSVVKEPADDYLKTKKIGVPYYDVDFMAGFLPVENNSQSTPDSYITHPFFKGCDYVVRASGQSMAKVISHGDAIGLIKVNNWQEFFPFGEIYAIVTKDGFRMIKVITKGETDDCFTLISKPTESKKEEFPPQQIKKSLILSIFKVQASSHLF